MEVSLSHVIYWCGHSHVLTHTHTHKHMLHSLHYPPMMDDEGPVPGIDAANPQVGEMGKWQLGWCTEELTLAGESFFEPSPLHFVFWKINITRVYAAVIIAVISFQVSTLTSVSAFWSLIKNHPSVLIASLKKRFFCQFIWDFLGLVGLKWIARPPRICMTLVNSQASLFQSHTLFIRMFVPAKQGFH